jgi:3-methyladenine DNA glycosylase AlkD
LISKPLPGERLHIIVKRSATINSANKTAKAFGERNVRDLENQIVVRLSTLKQRDVQTLRTVRRQFSKHLTTAPPELIIDLALKLIQNPEIVPRFFAYELVQQHRGANQSLNAKSLEDLGREIDNWVAVDTFACYLAGPAWRQQQVSDALIQRWARSRNRWWRRAR